MAPKLEWSDALGRMTRTEPLPEQGILTWDLVRTAILEGNGADAIAWLRYIQTGENYVTPQGRVMAGSVQNQLSYISRRWGEDHVEGALRYWRRKLIDAGDEPTYAMTPLERLQHHTEMERADYGGGAAGFTIVEESDRYVMTADRCSGCRQVRPNPPAPLPDGATTKPFSWSWGQTGIPYYTAHLCLWWEVMAIEDIGYPVRIHEIVDDDSQSCRVSFYKSPELIPESHFTRVGARRDPARFRELGGASS